jgi:hypothetical protein
LFFNSVPVAWKGQIFRGLPMDGFATDFRNGSWEREIYELLSLVVIGVCFWMAGDRLGVFSSASRIAKNAP